MVLVRCNVVKVFIIYIQSQYTMQSLFTKMFEKNAQYLKNNNYDGFRKKIFLLLCIITILVVISRIIIIQTFGENNFTSISFLINILPAIVAITAVSLIIYNNYTAGKLIMLTLIPLFTLLISVTEKENSVGILFLLFALVTLIFQDKKVNLILSFLLNISCYALDQFYFYQLSHTVDNYKNLALLLLNATLFFSITFFLLYYLKSTINFYLQRMTNDNNALANINTDLILMHTELKEKNKKLESDQFEMYSNSKHLSKIFSVISHDLKSPLVSVKNILNYTKDLQEDGKHVIVQYIPEIGKTVTNTLALLDNLLAWSRNQNTSEIKQEVVHVKAIIDEVVELYSLPIKSKSINFQVENPLNAFVSFNKPMLHTVLRNLISNAVKFTPIGGKTKIVVLPVNNNIRIQVCNEVDNVTDETIEKLNRNIDILQNGTAGECGSGFGLVVAKDFLESNNTQLVFNQKNNKIVIAEFVVKGYNNTKLKAVTTKQMPNYTIAFAR